MRITDLGSIVTVLAYCKAHRIPCWVIRTPPTSTIGGFSAQLISISIGDDTAEIEIANGDRLTVPTGEIHIRAQA